MEMKEKVQEILEQFDIKASYTEHVGPSVTRVDVTLHGTPISTMKSMNNLKDDVTLGLGVRHDEIRVIEPTPENPYYSYELPNGKRTQVPFVQDNYQIVLGKGIDYRDFKFDLIQNTPLLIGGRTGSGKTEMEMNLVSSLLYKVSPDELRFVLIDTKFGEFRYYNDMPHLLMPTIKDSKSAIGVLEWLAQEIPRRYEILRRHNRIHWEPFMEVGPQIVIIIDELSDLMIEDSVKTEALICRIAQAGKSAGIHLIVSTQRASEFCITGLIKANIFSRIAFQVAFREDSKLILDQGGAEALIGMGDMLVDFAGQRTLTRVQGVFISEKDARESVRYARKKYGKVNYDRNAMKFVDDHIGEVDEDEF